MAGAEEQLPSKLLNDGRIHNQGSTSVLLNAYRLNLKGAQEQIWKHELKFVATTARNQEKDLSAGPRNDVAKETRRRLLWECYEQMRDQNEDLFGASRDSWKGLVYDCGINFYSIRKLLDLQENREFAIEKTRLSDRSQSYLGRMDNIRARLLCTEVINLKSLDAIAENRDRTAVQFLDILSSQDLIRKDEYYMFASKMFEKASRVPLGQDPRILKEGMQKNVRFVGDNFADALPVVQIDAKKSAFFPEMNVDEFAERFLSDSGNLRLGVFNPLNLRLLTKQLRNLTVITLHMKTNRTIVINGLTDKPATQVHFEFNGQQIDVVSYYQQQYNMRVKFPDLPCVIERRNMGPEKGVQESFYLLEVLKILPGQRVPLDKQTPKLTEQMIKNCQIKPVDFQAQTDKQRGNAFIASANPYFKAHGVKADTDLINVNADQLFSPAIVYDQNDRVEEVFSQQGQLLWKMPPRRRFLAPSSLGLWACVLVENCVAGNEITQFLEAFIRSANGRGIQMRMPDRSDHLPGREYPGRDLATIRKLFEFYKRNNCKFAMFITKDKTDPIHHHFKLMEVEYGVITQHITKQTMLKAIGDRGAFMVIDNLMFKFNLKLGGVNYTLSTTQTFANRNGVRHDIVSNEWLGGHKMFIGLDLSHASPQGLFDRQAGVPPSEPTIVGMSYTMGKDKTLKMRGTYWMQESRLTNIKYLKDKVKQALYNFGLENKSPPRHVVVFRGGASEGEYTKVANEERQAIQDAFRELSKEHSCKPPEQLTIVVCQRGSNYRIVPQKINPADKPPEQNCRAGTVVDKHVMHPTYTEFLLIGHRTIQGTAQPVRCTVVYDKPERVPLQELEYVSYHLCYAHGIVTSPVGVPAPLYAASDLAKRGRNNWKIANYGEGDDSGSGGSRGKYRIPGPLDDAGQEHFFVNMSNELQPTITTKFWA